MTRASGKRTGRAYKARPVRIAGSWRAAPDGEVTLAQPTGQAQPHSLLLAWKGSP